ncbi:PREDICTED: lipocalin-1-like [Dipodomys ordii]|uniref:Lipocalin-1-like n=1 Tax=Dipodomys ordii TaxID=10020 RepID=A0A1S3GUB2_DIPOR|nr:PREDICTED: lipocalin-1-like [Dipodomys ordii]
MKTLLLTAVLLGLVAALQAQEPLSGLPEAQNLAGTWYEKAVASHKNTAKEKMHQEAFPITVTTLEGGNLEARATIMHEGRCHEIKVQMQKTDEPGKYIDVERKKLIYIEHLPMKDHSVFFAEGQHFGKTFRIAKLMGKTPEPNAEALEEFQRFAQRKGFQEENIFVPKQKGPCFRSRGVVGLEPLAGPLLTLAVPLFLQKPVSQNSNWETCSPGSKQSKSSL